MSFRVANVAGWVAVAAGAAVVVTAPEECMTLPGVPSAIQCQRSQGRVILGMSLGLVGFCTAMFTAFGFK